VESDEEGDPYQRIVATDAAGLGESTNRGAWQDVVQHTARDESDIEHVT
jgi:hypothetical protein